MPILEVRTLAELEGYESQLDELLAQSRDKCLYATYDYIVSWIQSFDVEKDAILLIAKENESIIGFCPLIRYRLTNMFFGQRISVRFAGEGLWGYTAILADRARQKDVLHEFLSYVFETIPFDIFEIGPFLESSDTYRLLKEDIDKKRALPSTLSVLKDTPHILPESDFHAYSTKLTKKSTFADAIRCQRRLSELGTVSVRKLNHECTREELSVLMKRFYEMYFAQWESNRFKRTPAFQTLYFEFAHAALRKRYAEISMLLLDEKIIAMHYGFLLSNCRYYFTPTYDRAYRAYSPGKVLLLELIKDSFNEKCEFDFLNDLEQYKLDWTDAIQSRAVITVYRKMWYGWYDSSRKKGFRQYGKKLSRTSRNGRTRNPRTREDAIHFGETRRWSSCSITRESYLRISSSYPDGR